MIVSSSASGGILAGVDIGTLTCRLLIAQISPSGSLRELRSDRRILRLGQDVDRNGLLRTDAMERVVATLKEWRHLIDDCQVESSAAVARKAERGAEKEEK